MRNSKIHKDAVKSAKAVKIGSQNVSDEGKDKVFAITAFVCGLLFWVPLFNMILSPMAVVFGILAIRRVRENPERYGGQGLAVTGLILGLLAIIFTVIGIYILLFRPELTSGFTIGDFLSVK
ncbi:MAG: DUF4190 domain-containing protein [Candidatus Woesearchaeota archaeon]